MFKHILVAVDGSDDLGEVMRKAVSLAKAFDSGITAVCVIDPHPFVGANAEFAFTPLQPLGEARVQAEQALAQARQVLSAEGAVVTTQVVEHATLWAGIRDAASTARADLVVMGSHGRKGLEKLILGSVAQDVIQHINIPVLVVRNTADGAA